MDFGFFGSYRNCDLEQRVALLYMPLMSLRPLIFSLMHPWGLITGQTLDFWTQFNMFVGPYTLGALLAGMQRFLGKSKLNLPPVKKTYSCKYIRRN